MDSIHAMIESALFRAALIGAWGGLVAAVRVDYQAFRSFTTYQQFAAYDWRVAMFRWVNGIVMGFLGTMLGGGVVGAL